MGVSMPDSSLKLDRGFHFPVEMSKAEFWHQMFAGVGNGFDVELYLFVFCLERGLQVRLG